MRQTTHTPGPWTAKLVDYADMKQVIEVSTASGFRVVAPGSIWGASVQECDDNAALIAAAPTLLEACEAMVVEFSTYFVSDDATKPHPLFIAAAAQARAAIERATK